MGLVKLATEPSRADSLTAYFRTRVLPASTLNRKLVHLSRRCNQGGPCRSRSEAGRAELRGITQPINRVLTIQ